MQTIGIAGIGPRLATVAHLLERNDRQIRYWRPDEELGGRRASDEPDFPEGVESVELDALAETPLIFVWMPVHRMRGFAGRLGDVLSGRHAVVHLGRTLEHATLNSVSTMLAEETPTKRFGFVTGPMAPDDVLEGRGASCVAASVFPEVIDMVEEVLTCQNFRVYRNDDLQGAEAAAAYARVISLAYGLAREMEMGKSLESTLFARGLAEMSKFVVYRGGYERTTFGLAGAGNLHADITEPGSVDYRIGRELGERGLDEVEEYRGELDVVDEEIFELLDSLDGQARRAELELHILNRVRDALLGEASLQEALGRLMSVADGRE